MVQAPAHYFEAKHQNGGSREEGVDSNEKVANVFCRRGVSSLSCGIELSQALEQASEKGEVKDKLR